MAQHDYDIADQPGASFLADLNAALAAIVTQNSGATEPSPTFAYQLWADTTAGRLKMRNASNTAWLDVMTLADAKALAAATADNATNLTGTSTSNIPTSALGSGTADSTTFLRGDRTFQTIPTMTATTGGLVPTPPNDVNQVLRGNGTFGAVASVGRLVNIVRITTPGSGTYYKPANINRLLIRAIGGGGGGGAGGGGGSGGYGELFITSPASSYAYTVGAGGSANGGAGGATTIAGISAGGGGGGTFTGGVGGTTSGASINVRGGAGGVRDFDGTTIYSGGNGGCGVFGGGGYGGASGGGGVFGGGGGGGGGSGGGTGGAGYIEIWEFE
jgi:hypothetical protein